MRKLSPGIPECDEVEEVVAKAVDKIFRDGPDARSLLQTLEKKIPLVKSLSGPMTPGVVARTIEGRETLIREGYFIREISDPGMGG
jgi:hypothetical protein